jgi:ubiquinone/menaquinone biosynthesis C-methylase UbiE
MRKNSSLPKATVNEYANRPLNPHRKAAIGKFAGNSFLDVGCGNGAYVLHFADTKQTLGIDFSEFEGWQTKPELFQIANATQIPYPDNSYDTVVAFELLEHIENPSIALREFRRIAEKNIIVTVPNCEQTPGMRESGLLFNHYSDPTHINFWLLEDLLELFAKENFRVIHFELINNINLVPLFSEATHKRWRLNWLYSKIFKRLISLSYPMTILLVADVNK